MAHCNIIPLFNGDTRTAVRQPRTEMRETLFCALDLGTGDSIVFADRSMVIVRVTDQAEEVHNMSCADLVGQDVRSLFPADAAGVVAKAFQTLASGASWAGEIDSRRMPDELFPADVTIKRILLEGYDLFCIVIRDLSETRRLRELLHQQHRQRREMYVTLRNLMKAFEKEKKGLEAGIHQKVRALLLPSIEKIGEEPSADIRAAYVNILRSQLVEVTRGVGQDLDARFLTLTRSEMQVCRLLQKGLATKEVADRLHISFETVQTHRRNIRRKLGLSGRRVNLHAYLADKALFATG